MMANSYRNFFIQSNANDIKVQTFHGSYEIDEHKQNERIDILVTSAFCIQTFLNNHKDLHESKRLQYVQFNNIHEMCHISDLATRSIVDTFLAREVPTQVVVNSGAYCPILKTIYDKLSHPLLVISMDVAFEAAVFANTIFSAEQLQYEARRNNLIGRSLNKQTFEFELKNEYKCSFIGKLRGMTGSIIVVCGTRDEIFLLSVFLSTGKLDHLSLRRNDLAHNKLGIKSKFWFLFSSVDQNLFSYSRRLL